MKQKTIIFLGTLALIGLLWVRFLHYQETKIEAQRLIEVEQIEQRAKVERTEERSQFWQKLVPWGHDEEEQSE